MVNQIEKYNVDYNFEGNKNHGDSSVSIGPYLYLKWHNWGTEANKIQLDGKKALCG